jgi:hypothetical protein
MNRILEWPLKQDSLEKSPRLILGFPGETPLSRSDPHYIHYGCFIPLYSPPIPPIRRWSILSIPYHGYIPSYIIIFPCIICSIYSPSIFHMPHNVDGHYPHLFTVRERPPNFPSIVDAVVVRRRHLWSHAKRPPRRRRCSNCARLGAVERARATGNGARSGRSVLDIWDLPMKKWWKIVI